MTYSEFKTELTGIVSNPDDMLAKLPDFMDKVRGDYETLDAMTEAKKSQEEKIRSLQDTNMKLFLNQVKIIHEDEDDDTEKKKTFDMILADAEAEEDG